MNPQAHGGRGLWVLAHHAQAQAEAGFEEDNPTHDDHSDHHKEADGLLGQNGADDGDGGKEVQGGGDGGHLGGGALVVPDELHQQGGDGQSQQVQSDAADDLVDLVAHGQDAVEQADDHAAHHAQQEAEEHAPGEVGAENAEEGAHHHHALQAQGHDAAAHREGAAHRGQHQGDGRADDGNQVVENHAHVRPPPSWSCGTSPRG